MLILEVRTGKRRTYARMCGRSAQNPLSCMYSLVTYNVTQLLNPDHTGDLEYEGRVILVVVIGPDRTQSADQVELTVRNMLNQQAEIFCFLKQSSSTASSLKILIEFCDVDAAALIIGKYHNFTTDVSLQSVCGFVGFHRLTVVLTGHHSVLDLEQGWKCSAAAPTSSPKGARYRYGGSYTPSVWSRPLVTLS